MREVNWGSDIPLPTLTGNLKYRDGSMEQVILMIDSGSQLSFISAHLAEQCNFPVMKENLYIDIKGFNTKTRYDIKSVFVQIALDNATFSFEASCVPTIRTSLKVKGMNKVASLFEKKGYTLANQVFHGCMNKSVSIMLGVNTCHVIETKVVTFEHNCNTSAYLDSRFGVIPVGSVSNILKNANFLPKASRASSSYSVT